MNFAYDVQPKSEGEMEDFEILNFCISLNSSQMCTHFFKDLVIRYFLYLVRNSIPNRHPFSNKFCYPHLLAMGLTSREICV